MDILTLLKTGDKLARGNDKTHCMICSRCGEDIPQTERCITVHAKGFTELASIGLIDGEYVFHKKCLGKPFI